ncbi:hypothetical protein OH77DRAFT_1544576 [Trametes cingulata]|nr:hypothetical protein OH77DRAFT_1544576 [Trametes cingulata]
MPKTSPTSTPSAIRSSGAPFHNAHVLRRNQACHQCRRRKLVSTVLSVRAAIVHSDAKRPCSTCVRSHSYAVAHASPDADLPPHPECTYDDSSEPPNTFDTEESSKDKFERLETRINELETLLQERERVRDADSRSRSTSHNETQNSSNSILGYADTIGLLDRQFPFNDHDLSAHIPGSSLNELSTPAPLLDGLLLSHNDTSSIPTSYTDSPPSDFGKEVTNPGWPKNLPSYPFLRHLVEAFFNFTPTACRLFHAPTFMCSLLLPPTHPEFPSPAILHAMCAMGSLYTAVVAPTPAPLPPVYYGGPGMTCPTTGSFADLQIKAARDAIESALRTTADLFSSLQAQVIVALWYWYNARHAVIAFAVSLRYAVPCGLNACPPFESISCCNMSRTSVIPLASTVMEDEMRRNTFWIAYMMERHFAAINNFAMMLDDQDISQMLPVRGEEFDHGVLVPPGRRQWSHDPDVIEKHLDDQVDSFILHVKATMLLSRVKVFNGRYNAKRHLGDPAMVPNPAGIPGMPFPNLVQSTPAFVELDRLIGAFLQSLPPGHKDPLANGVIDTSLFTAISTAHFTTIVLHEGHARIGRPGCISSCKVLAAARSILNLLYEAYSTSHNLALLGVFPMVCWFGAGRVLVRFLKAAIEAQSDEHTATLQAEVNFFRSVISGIGESVPHAFHYGKMLNDYLVQTCGKEYATPVGPPSIQP